MTEQAALQLPGVLTHAQAMACQGALTKQWPKVSEQSEVCVDASALKQFDSSALALLLSCRRMAEKAGQAIQVTGAPPRLQQLARLYGVADLLNMKAAVVSQ